MLRGCIDDAAKIALRTVLKTAWKTASRVP